MKCEINKVKCYGYYLVRKSDGMKYVGVRYANVKLNLTPSEDFGKVYFTSGSFRKEFKKNPRGFEFKIKRTFDNIEDMFEWEKGIVLRVYKRDDWANNGWGTNYGENPNIGKLISAGKYKVKPNGKTAIQEGKEKLVKWIYNTPEGDEWRNFFSVLHKKRWAGYSKEKIEELNRKRVASTDFRVVAAKGRETTMRVRECGTSIAQETARKSANTMIEEGTYIRKGEEFSRWCKEDSDGIAYVEWAKVDSKRRMDELSAEEKKRRSDMMKETIASKPESIKREIGNKISESTKKYVKKLGEMSEEDFENHIKYYKPRGKQSALGRRNRYRKENQLD